MDTNFSEIIKKDSFSNYIRKSKSDSITFSNITFDNFFKITNRLEFDTLYKESSIPLTNRKIIEITEIKELHFENCKFTFAPQIDTKNIWLIKFEKCTFNESLKIPKENSLLNTTHENKQVYFNECSIDELHIGDVRHKKYNSNIELCNFKIHGGTIKKLIIENIELKNKFYINRQRDNDKQIKITKLQISNTTFLENFKLHNALIDEILLKDVDFEKQADFFLSSFIKSPDSNDLTFNAINIKGLAIFEQCEFYNKISFNYVTFESFSNFRNATFHKGLDLECTNIQNNINFVGIKGLDNYESKENTSIETYRIIKHNFIELDNKIEANKYQSLELNKQRKEIWNNEKINIELLSDGIVSFFHYLSSAHSRYWVIPLLWILIIGIITSCLISEINPFDIQKFISWLIQKDTLESILKYAYLGNFDEYFNEEIKIFLFNKISLGYLYYQFLITIRRNTKNI